MADFLGANSKRMREVAEECKASAKGLPSNFAEVLNSCATIINETDSKALGKELENLKKIESTKLADIATNLSELATSLDERADEIDKIDSVD